MLRVLGSSLQLGKPFDCSALAFGDELLVYVEGGACSAVAHKGFGVFDLGPGDF
jgi:hypothetical protein